MVNGISYNEINLKDIIQKVQKVLLPYQVTKLSEKEQSVLEKILQGLPQEEQANVIRIAGEIFLDEMPLDVKEGRWRYCVLYGIVEFLQDLQDHYKEQAE